MVSYRRNRAAGATYFFTVALADRRSTALVDHVAILRAATAATRSRWPFQIDAMVVLPDHLHCVWTLPANDSDFPKRWRSIKAGVTRSLKTGGVDLPRFANGEYAFWQQRFWEHTIRDDDDLERHVDYIHFNPVKHGLVKAPVAWPHSSLHRYIRQGLLPADWAGVEERAEGSFGE